MEEHAVSEERAVAFQRLVNSIEINKMLKKREEELLLILEDKTKMCCQLEQILKQRGIDI